MSNFIHTNLILNNSDNGIMIITETTTDFPPIPKHDSLGMWPVIAGLFAFIATGFSLYEIYQHLLHYNKPYLQKYIVRILWMVPIYAMNSWFGMFFSSISMYMDTLREFYEAFVIYSFMKYLFNFLHCDVPTYEIIIDCKPNVPHIFPFCFISPMRGGRKFIQTCRHGMIQYIIIRPITTFIALSSELIGIYGEGRFTYKYTYFWLLIINNISQTYAMYVLVQFYQQYKYELAPMKPLGKFLCIKAVVFFSFFQGVILMALIKVGFITQAFIPASMHINNYDMSRNLQDFLICFEMLIAAIAHVFVFSHQPFVDYSQGTNPIVYNFNRMIDFSEERHDINDHLRHVTKMVRNIIPQNRNGRYEPIEENTSAPLIPMTTRKTYGGTFDSNSG